MRSVTTVFAVGMIGGAGVLMAVPADEGAPLFPAAGTIPDPPALPCKRQAWPNTDRGCLKWTAQRPELASSEPDRAPVHIAVQASMLPSAAQRDEVGTRDSAHQAPAPPQPTTLASEAPGERSPRLPRTAQRSQSEAARTMRGLGDTPARISVVASTSDGTRRAIVIRPTSMQDVYYYSRHDVAAIGPTLGRKTQ
jgi:hypothetical protein